METTGPAWQEFTPADFQRGRRRGHKPPTGGQAGLFVPATVPVGLKPATVKDDPGQLDLFAPVVMTGLEPAPDPGESDCLESQ